MGDWTPADRRFSELPLRLASALVLIPLALGAVWMGGIWLAAACAAFAYVMMLEWCGMSAAAQPRIQAVLGAVFGLSLAANELWLPVAALMAGGVFAVLTAHGGAKARLTAGFGVIYVYAMVGALYGLREGPWDGRAAALYFMSFVWASDAAAYFVGRALRGPRLLPSESPNKTWSGALGAIIACSVCGYSAASLQQADHGIWIMTGIAISIFAQAGDLFESGLKRRFKVKDSGTILPGHGGLLDRVDGLGAVSIAGCLALAAIPGFSGALGL
ncbi:phosphatidate cytidylyltransferase [Hyphomonas sp.]|uniref:phosphatidate cytidylyltransferase n=1 Tax=Hyphomonas sp. TaxID=87 RepID=UPI0039196066